MSYVFTWGASIGNIRPDGVTGLMVKCTNPQGSADAAYYSLGNIEGAKFTTGTQEKNDTIGRNFNVSNLYKATVPSLQASKAEILILDYLITAAPLDYIIPLTDGVYIISPISGVNKLSLNWKLTCGADGKDFRKIEYALQGNMLRSEMAAMIVAASGLPSGSYSGAIGTPSGSDLLYAITASAAGQTPVVADQVPNGITKIEVEVPGDTGYQDFGDFFNAQYTFECSGGEGGGGRQFLRTSSIKFNFTATGNETALAQIGILPTIMSNPINMRLTHTDGTKLTITSANIGFTTSLDVAGNAEKNRPLMIKSQGVIPIADTTVATFHSVWSGLWS